MEYLTLLKSGTGTFDVVKGAYNQYIKGSNKLMKVDTIPEFPIVTDVIQLGK